MEDRPWPIPSLPLAYVIRLILYRFFRSGWYFSRNGRFSGFRWHRGSLETIMPFVLCQEFPFRVPWLEYFLQLSGIQDFLELIEILLLRVEHFLSHFEMSFHPLLDLLVSPAFLFDIRIRSLVAGFHLLDISLIQGSEFG